jgi:hypothetical protein
MEEIPRYKTIFRKKTISYKAIVVIIKKNYNGLKGLRGCNLVAFNNSFRSNKELNIVWMSKRII